jgi:hypothetical protein
MEKKLQTLIDEDRKGNIIDMEVVVTESKREWLLVFYCHARTFFIGLHHPGE